MHTTHYTFYYISIALLLAQFLRFLVVSDGVAKAINRFPTILKYIWTAIKIVFGVIYFTVFEVVSELTYYVSSFGKFLLGFPLWGIFVLGVIYVILFFILPDSIQLEPFSNQLFDSLSRDGLTDKQIIVFISGITRILEVIVSTLVPFYYFIYREQKAPSAGHTLTKIVSLRIFAISSVFTIPYGLNLTSVLSRIQPSSDTHPSTLSLAATAQEHMRCIIWFVLCVISVTAGIYMLRSLLRSMDVRWSVREFIKKADLKIQSLYFFPGKKRRGNVYETLHSYIESIYQMTSFSVEKNMDRVYNEDFHTWISVLSKTYDSPPLNFFSMEVTFKRLLKRNPEDFQSLFRLVLRSHSSLIMTLYKNHKIKEATECIDQYFKLMPSDESLRSLHLQCVHELAVLLYDNGSGGLEHVLNTTRSMILNQTPAVRTQMLPIIESLTIRAVQKNDVHILAALAHLVHQSSKTQTVLASTSVGKQVQRGLSTSISLNVSSEDDYVSGGVYVLLEAALKSVELGHYSCTGFLVKYIVTSFDSNVLHDVLLTFVARKGHKNPYIKSDELNASVDISFPFNENTTEYCLKKLGILLYGQQNYVLKRRVDFGFIPDRLVNIKFVRCSYLDYLFNKLDKAKTKYGLSYLEDIHFMKELRQSVVHQTL